MSTCFIADLHLSADAPETTDRFLHFLSGEAGRHEALYILGDLFEVWLGDTLPAPGSEPILKALRTLVQQGTAVFVQHGNRDFLLGSGFERESGCRLIPDPTLIELDGTRILLAHGDQLCTGDLSYQKYRRFIRHPLTRWILLHLPRSTRTGIGERLRQRSNYDKANKQSEIMDVTQSEVERVMREKRADVLIHGHTHRPGNHTFELSGRAVQRLVVGDWSSRNNILIYSEGTFTQQTFPDPHIESRMRAHDIDS